MSSYATTSNAGGAGAPVRRWHQHLDVPRLVAAVAAAQALWLLVEVSVPRRTTPAVTAPTTTTTTHAAWAAQHAGD